MRKGLLLLVLCFCMVTCFGSSKAEAAPRRYNIPIVVWSSWEPCTITWQAEEGSHKVEIRVYVCRGAKKSLVKTAIVKNNYRYNLTKVLKKYKNKKVYVAIRSLGTKKRRTSLWGRSEFFDWKRLKK